MEIPKILYVDDEIINLELFQLTFMNVFQVLVAESAEEGLKLLALNSDIHVVIADLKMPGMNGMDFIKEAKKMNQERVCMLLTGFMEPNIMMEGLNKELIFRYILKPWNKDELDENIRAALNH